MLDVSQFTDNHRHPKEYQEWAYQLWAHVCGRNLKRVKERIAEPQPGDPHPAYEIPHSTLQYWCQSQKWPVRVREDFQKLAPDLHETITQNLMNASVEASRWVLDMMNDRVPMDTMTQVGAAKTKLDAAKTAFDRVGIMPWLLTADRGKPVAPTRSYDAAIGQMSEDDLRALMYRKLEEKIAPDGIFLEEDEDESVYP